MFKTAYITSVIIAVSAPAWAPYLLGFGGHERLVITGLLFVFVVLLVSTGLFAVSLFRLISSLICRRPCKGIGRLLLAFATICLVVVLPQLIAVNARKLGALNRLQRAGGEAVYGRMMDAANSVLIHSSSEDAAPTEIPQIFALLGVKYVNTHAGSPAFVNAVTSGRPFRTGWLLYPNLDEPTVTKGVKVHPGIYRY